MKQKFRESKLGKQRLALLNKVNSILEEYANDGYTLSLRQLYYQLVARDVIPNTVNDYRRIGDVLTEGRMSGIVDWNHIEDRVRELEKPYSVDGVEDAIGDVVRAFRLDRQVGQKNHIEVWSEKDAISNIIERQTRHYGVGMMVNKGYSSTSAMYVTYNRMERAIKQGKEPIILYLGDHDPSGLDMIENDIPKRLNETFGTDVKIIQIGITMEQIKELDPPPNPAKITDPRAGWYLDKYGESSWEVDALSPQFMANVIKESIENSLDMNIFNDVLEREEIEKLEIQNLPKDREKFSSIRNLVKEKMGDVEFLSKIDTRAYDFIKEIEKHAK